MATVSGGRRPHLDGGLGTTVCYHRALAHRALRLHPVVQEILIFFAMYNGSGAPLSWAANHRLHHAMADTPEDISSHGRRVLVGAPAVVVAS